MLRQNTAGDLAFLGPIVDQSKLMLMLPYNRVVYAILWMLRSHDLCFFKELADGHQITGEILSSKVTWKVLFGGLVPDSK